MTANVIEMITDYIMKAGREHYRQGRRKEVPDQDERRIGGRSATSAGYS